MVGVVTAVVALIGYWSNQHIKRRETKIRVYAEALLAIHHYEELPYAIRHRKQAEDGEVRAELAEKMSDVFARINYYQTLLNMDAPVVGQAYAALFARTRQYGGPPSARGMEYLSRCRRRGHATGRVLSVRQAG
ncbi:hypothetical protein [Streptomyces sp. NBC_00154]|uniref:hypothetical protein n=1 Tax=Streptomyces sp. NBC_00154 TaxID=2975670 RepID=UPI0022552508|nr:hypothetical protein [Streptomyces sp. NBC_00154]MCX5318151.1 hypothetical protein [Streptomyces sp. NBC_00154]